MTEFSGIHGSIAWGLNYLFRVPAPFLKAWPESEVGLFLTLAEDANWPLYSVSEPNTSCWTIPLAGNYLSPEWFSDFVISWVLAKAILSTQQEEIRIGSLGGSVNSVYLVHGPGTLQAMGRYSEGLSRCSALILMSSPCCCCLQRTPTSSSKLPRSWLVPCRVPRVPPTHTSLSLVCSAARGCVGIISIGALSGCGPMTSGASGKANCFIVVELTSVPHLYDIRACFLENLSDPKLNDISWWEMGKRLKVSQELQHSTSSSPYKQWLRSFLGLLTYKVEGWRRGHRVLTFGIRGHRGWHWSLVLICPVCSILPRLYAFFEELMLFLVPNQTFWILRV